MKLLLILSLFLYSVAALSSEENSAGTFFSKWFNSKGSDLTKLTAKAGSNNSQASNNFMAIIGGGGDPVPLSATQATPAPPKEGFYEDPRHEGTIFDTSLANTSRFVASSNFKTQVSFNGGHSKTEKIISDNFKAEENKGGFTPNSYNQLIDNYIAKLKAAKDGKGPPVDKILIFISTHGAEKDLSRSSTHRICTGNCLTNEEFVDISKLAELSELVKGTKTKLAILDLSCHSGNSLPISNDNTCVISASGPLHYGYTSFADNYSNNMKSGKNLEEIFLETRQATNGEGFPMISSPAGKAVQDALYPLITPYLFYHAETQPNGASVDKIDHYLMNNACSVAIYNRDQKFLALNKLIQDIEDINTKEVGVWIFKSKIKNVDLSELKKQVAAYKEFQDKYLNEIQKLNLPDFKKKVYLETSFGSNSDYSVGDILATNFEKRLEEEYQDAQLISGEAAMRNHNFRKELYQNALSKQRELRQNPEIMKQQEILNKINADEKTTYKMAMGIAAATQTAYDGYYKNQSVEKTNETNPCRDFVL